MLSLSSLFYVDSLSIVMMGLISFVGSSVISFSMRYLSGDRYYHRFFINLIALLGSVLVMVAADNLWLLLASLCIGNFFLVRLIGHNTRWPAARASALIAFKNFAFGAILFAVAFFLFFFASGESSVQGILKAELDSVYLLPAMGIFFFGVMTQSGVWPFHRWLISSLNSPTPVSAIMHAGVVNAGGFLLARFAPIYINNSRLLTVIFVLGMVSAVLGTFWKLIQSDVKRMLACSTVGQMGFMLAQCGLGLFASAIVHLVCHGLFKAYLFLASGGAAQEERIPAASPSRLTTFLAALVCGLAGAYAFSVGSSNAINPYNTSFLLMALVGVFGAQFALSLLADKLARAPVALVVTSVTGYLYGLGVYGVEMLIRPLDVMEPQPLNGVYILGFGLLIGLWLFLTFGLNRISRNLPFLSRLYVSQLNASQPHPETVTAHHNQYQY